MSEAKNDQKAATSEAGSGGPEKAPPEVLGDFENVVKRWPADRNVYAVEVDWDKVKAEFERETFVACSTPRQAAIEIVLRSVKVRRLTQKEFGQRAAALAAELLG